jgi:protein gp37
MTTNSAIEWTGHTWNPWQGCTKVSPGCARCYMYSEKRRWGQDPEIVVRSKPGTFRKPLGWKEPALVFTCSWSDWFHEAADPWRQEAWEIVEATPWLTYQVLTKRAERIAPHLPANWGPQGYPNVWLGVSTENQVQLDRRVPYLLDVPARVRFLSCEPLLGPLDLRPRPSRELCIVCGEGPDAPHEHRHGYRTRGLDWVIAGGESGAKARPCDEAWLRSLRDQCAHAGVPFFLKQLGGFPDKRGGAAAALDGVLHHAMPAVRA